MVQRQWEAVEGFTEGTRTGRCRQVGNLAAAPVGNGECAVAVVGDFPGELKGC